MCRIPLAAVLLGFVAPASGQTFGFVHQMLPADGEPSTCLALGDVDGDGDLDELVGSASYSGVPGRVRLSLNDGTGSFADATAANLPAVLDEMQAIALADVDGDGDLDALLGTPGQDRLLLNAGAGTFVEVTATNLPALLDNTRAVALGDFDGDGDLDVLVGNFLEPNRLLLNGGAGVFTDATATNLPAQINRTTSLALGDVDGDGDLDAFAGRLFSFFLPPSGQLFLNNGGGVFADATPTNLPVLYDDTEAVAIGDVDADGDLDAFLGNLGGPDRLLLNGGSGIFTTAPFGSLPYVSDETRSLALGDVDADGDLDAFLGSAYTTAAALNRLYLNNGTGSFLDATAANLDAPAGDTRAVGLGDVDGDGDLDALAGNGLWLQQDRLLLNDGTGILTDVTATGFPSSSDNTLGVAVGDVDGDGDLDALAGNTGQDRLLLNDGTGILTDVTGTNLPAIFDLTLDVALGDVDGDGDLDGLTGNAGQPARLYQNGGSAVFTDVTAASLPPLSNPSGLIGLGDVDGDGDLDTFAGGGADRLLLNGGTGTFTVAPATSLPAGSGNSSSLGFGDVEGDGDLDIVLGCIAVAPGAQNRLYLNDGTGVFTDATATNLPSVLDTTTDVALGDVDGDGDLDSFVANAEQVDRLLLNGGTGVFTDATAVNLPALIDTTLAVALGDVDEDGDLDAFLGNADGLLGEQSRLYLNGGTGNFTDATAASLSVLPDRTYAVALGDADGDGDLDVFAGIRDQDRLHVNLSRQLSWRAIPRAGKPLTLDLRGPASGSWLLAASAGSANIPLPPFGTLRLFPPTLFVVAGGALDPQGRASLSFPVPGNAALVGLSLYWQAVVGPPVWFTNLEVTTVTNL